MPRMGLRLWKFFASCVIFLLLLHDVSHDCAAAESEGQKEAQEESNDPVIFVRVLQTKPTYTRIEKGGWQYNQTNRVLLPFAGSLIPGVRLGKTYSITRLEAPILYRSTPQLSQWGARDFTLFDLMGGDTGFGAAGLGPLVSMPTATNTAFGTGKWSIGPAAGLTVRSVKGFRFSVLLQQFFSVAGDSSRATVSTLWLQPNFAMYFPHALSLITDPIYKFDWTATTATLPVNLQVGKAFNRNLSCALGPEYIANGPTSGNWSIKGTVNYLNW